MTPTPIKSICIVGGGTAGWMTAAGLSNKFSDLDIDITLIESEQIGTVGVGEATLPHIRFFNNTLGISEQDFMKATQATFKLGIEFCDWGNIGDAYIHPFGDFGMPINGIEFYHFWTKLCQNSNTHRLDSYSYPVILAQNNKFGHPSEDIRQIESTLGYAYQFDSSLYGRFLRDYAQSRNVIRKEGKIVTTHLNAQNGNVQSVQLEDGSRHTADLFIDCSGFRGLLIEQALRAGYEDWSPWLPCNRAIAVASERLTDLPPYTRATACKAGWQWRIPLQHRTGNGYVYCSDYISDDAAAGDLLSKLNSAPLTDPKQLYFKTGRRKTFWSKNVVAIGLSAGFLEPLESTSIHLIQEGITELIQLFPDMHMRTSDRDEYNRRMSLNYERVRDFLLLHYVATQRDDSPMWQYFQNMTLPDSLQAKIDAWKTRGHIMKYQFGVFLPASWVAVMIGQNLIPAHYDPRVDMLSHDRLKAEAESLRGAVRDGVDRAMRHDAYIQGYGAASGTFAQRSG
ncbi:tryptophan halogenase family protein [Robiginitomaculum antarcticum]|uniref:tryptophan halogenase family protein n=1 Tax=Robiginitomaculum antarcticum TaxID=437507 RepID=UPI00036511CD|nr:tryptophan halogenase family protein [Robiginitomaculum antarcticum]